MQKIFRRLSAALLCLALLAAPALAAEATIRSDYVVIEGENFVADTFCGVDALYNETGRTLFCNELIERFYSRFYPNWNSKAYYGLMEKLKVTPDQKISSMSNGQRSQVALGLILAQNADLLVLDDFSLGLDPGYRRLFIEYLRDFVKSEGKTVFMTSHIIQDLERLVDDCIIMDYGRILTQMPVDQLMSTLRRYSYSEGKLPEGEGIFSPWHTGNENEFYSFLTPDELRPMLAAQGIAAADLKAEAPASLEDAFIGLTGRY